MRRTPFALVVLVLIGLALRLATWVVYSPVVMSVADSAVYVGLASDELFSGANQTAGYPAFLRFLHFVSDQLELTVLVQHLLGVATGLMLYAAVRRVGAPVWAGAVAAAAVLLSLDQIFLEHTLMTESLFTFVLVAAAYCAIRALAEPHALYGLLTTRMAWIVAAGALLGLSTWIRSYTVLLIPLLGLWLLLAYPAPWKRRVAGSAFGVGAALLVVLTYAAAHGALTGYYGLTRSSGWAVYARTAQFADCTRFTPPAGTRRLCEQTPPEERFGPDFYAWEPGSPARRAYGGQPNGSEQLSAFARAAVLSQKLDYMKAVTNDTMRYFVPSWNADRPYGGVGYELMDIDRRAEATEQALDAQLDTYYAPDRLRIRGGAQALNDLQQVFRVQPIVLLQLLILGVAGMLACRGPVRSALVLLVGAAGALLVIPPATAIFSARYAVPVDGLLAAAGALGAWVLLQRRATSPIAKPGGSPPGSRVRVGSTEHPTSLNVPIRSGPP